MLDPLEILASSLRSVFVVSAILKSIVMLAVLQRTVWLVAPGFTGKVWSGASRNRTGDLLGAIQALSHLSYSPKPPLTCRHD